MLSRFYACYRGRMASTAVPNVRLVIHIANARHLPLVMDHSTGALQAPSSYVALPSSPTDTTILESPAIASDANPTYNVRHSLQFDRTQVTDRRAVWLSAKHIVDRINRRVSIGYLVAHSHFKSAIKMQRAMHQMHQRILLVQLRSICCHLYLVKH